MSSSYWSSDVCSSDFYENIGLMPLAARTDSGRRTYGEADVRRMKFIRNGRELGFSTEELKSLISLSEQPDRDCGAAAAIARRHLADVEARMARLAVLPIGRRAGGESGCKKR